MPSVTTEKRDQVGTRAGERMLRVIEPSVVDEETDYATEFEEESPDRTRMSGSTGNVLM